MSSTNGEIGMRNLTDKATYERLEKDVAAVKNDISALTDQITMDAAQDAAHSIEETLEDVITQRPLATVGLALGLGFLIGVTWRR